MSSVNNGSEKFNGFIFRKLCDSIMNVCIITESTDAGPDLEQLTAGSAAARHRAWRIPSITEDISVCLGTAETAAH